MEKTTPKTVSKDGKGRSLWDILTGKNKRDLTPMELQYHNTLGAKIGCTVSIDQPEYSEVNFVIEKISVYETKVKQKKFYHTDYHLRGISLSIREPIVLKLRLIPDGDVSNALGCKVQLLRLYDEMEWDDGFYANVLLSETGQFDVNQDEMGNELAEPHKFWRIEDVLDPYMARVTILSDKDGHGVVEEAELERVDITYWDYHRNATEPGVGEYREYLTVEMKDPSRYFVLYKGTEVQPSQITVI